MYVYSHNPSILVLRPLLFFSDRQQLSVVYEEKRRHDDKATFALYMHVATHCNVDSLQLCTYTSCMVRGRMEGTACANIWHIGTANGDNILDVAQSIVQSFCALSTL